MFQLKLRGKDILTAKSNVNVRVTINAQFGGTECKLECKGDTKHVHLQFGCVGPVIDEQLEDT